MRVEDERAPDLDAVPNLEPAAADDFQLDYDTPSAPAPSFFDSFTGPVDPAALEALLFAAGDPVPAERLATILGVGVDDVNSCATQLMQQYDAQERGIRMLHLKDAWQLCSDAKHAVLVQKILEQRKPPKLSPAALEVLAITAYYQPVTRAYIDQMRGVDSAYTISVLVDRGLLVPVGRLDVPGRPTLFGTGDMFLRTMGISDLTQLPTLPDMTSSEGVEELQKKIDAMRAQA